MDWHQLLIIKLLINIQRIYKSPKLIEGQIHQNSIMMKINYDVDLLLNLFEQMFEYNPFQRIQFDKIFEHELVSKYMVDASFHLNDSALEAYVRALYHQTKHNNKKNQQVKHKKNKHQKKPKKCWRVVNWFLNEWSQ